MLRRRNSKSEWIDGEIIKLCDEKDEIWKRCKKEPGNKNLKEEYRRIRNKVTAKLRLAKNRYYLEKFLINKKNTKNTWGLLNQLIGKQKKRSIDDTIIRNFKNSDVCSLTSIFNDHFIQAIEGIRGAKIPPSSDEINSHATCSQSAYLPDMTENDLWYIVNQIPTFKPAGVDGIRPRDVFRNYKELRSVIQAKINGILKTGIIPNEMKISVVRPLYKKGKKCSVDNYRPISILSVITHIMEKYLARIMINFCEKNSLLTSTQYGFKK